MVSLVTPKQIAERTKINGNIDLSSYSFLIRETQKFLIEVILGKKLYKKIETDFKNKTLTGDYLILYEDYLINIICYHVAHEFVETHNIQLGTGGIFKHNPENGQAVDKPEVDYLANKYLMKSDEYISRMMKFLCVVNLPEYEQPQDERYDLKPVKNSPYIGGWKIR